MCVVNGLSYHSFDHFQSKKMLLKLANNNAPKNKIHQQKHHLDLFYL
jgi:hypothetical protein